MTEFCTPASERLPYIVSADAAGLLGRWAAANGYNLPPQEFFGELTEELGSNLKQVTGLDIEIVPEKEMRDGMDRLVHSSPYPVVSLDRAYFDGQDPAISGYIDVTRAVREKNDDRGGTMFVSIGGLAPRPGFPTLREQLDVMRSVEPLPITLLDDVIFSGECTVDLARQLSAIGRPVARIIAGIGIEEGVTRLQDEGIEVECVRTYDDVADEVCQRDFLAGVPMSGRTVLGEGGYHWSAPYFLPYGHPEGWASIPAGQCQSFSKLCIEQSLSLWSEIESVSGRNVPAAAVPRVLRGSNAHASITTLLRDHLKEI